MSSGGRHCTALVRFGSSCHRECETLSGREPEGAESVYKWRACEKNPGHSKFISAQDFKDNYLPRLQTNEFREEFRSIIDRTVRLRVQCTSLDRPDDDHFAKYRGTDKTRLATGYICYVEEPKYNKPCFCLECRGKVVRKQWTLRVKTAHHVVYNTEEAKETKIDFFYDDDSCMRNGRMKTVRGVAMGEVYRGRDWCDMWCVTCDGDLGERIEAACRYRFKDIPNSQDISFLGLQPSCDEDCEPALIVSHPHGQPKKITVGKLRYRDREDYRVEYNTPTCPGSSGAQVFWFVRDGSGFYPPVHSGSSGKTSTENKHQLNNLRGYETSLGVEQINYAARSYLMRLMWTQLNDFPGVTLVRAKLSNSSRTPFAVLLKIITPCNIITS
ncbi:hypothetical protein ElyMa_006455200 [Elysia marginata]|uniref:Uncharacterized protein n=1 Tax=Elysia marginata TaxID=1093978 RepID=A0AAV4I2D2_9GAST|nr:hypothetical protein ElyMa_006455200 [Elysia marginata]